MDFNILKAPGFNIFELWIYRFEKHIHLCSY